MLSNFSATLRIFDIPRLAKAVKRAAPGVPFLVKIWITPFEASVPYRVAAAGPLMTSIDSMLLGSMSLSREVGPQLKPRPVSLSTRTPST
ncbi:MAG: hypothetical protein F4Z92_14460 [Gemmatimonadetes bacterium]|nr:hypothetical protein [Gemmatimonadota bacterium]